VTYAVSALEEPVLPGNGVHTGFFRQACLDATRPALEIGGDVWTYGRLLERVSRVAATLERHTPAGGPNLTAIFAHRSAAGPVGILAALAAGCGYVPLNRTFPIERTRLMLRTAGCRSLVVDADSSAQLDALLDGIEEPLLIVLPDHASSGELAARWPGHTFVAGGELEPAAHFIPQDAGAEDIAYLLFTSGSTGTPKAVPVTHANAAQFVRTALARYGITPADRVSQMFDLTFDLSVFDMFVAWSAGACVCCPSESAMLKPDAFIRDSQLTVWLSVPSVGILMQRTGVLKPGRYPSLRLSLFCGEPLPSGVAEAWAAAAPHSLLENLYGPTEATVACMAYRWTPVRSRDESVQGIVPIGEPFPGVVTLVVDESLNEVEPGQTGELLLGGAQVTSGYWRNPEATARAYVARDGAIFYRTGDRVRRPVGSQPMTFVGRLDDQVKIRGFRVELGEVESCLRAQAGVASAAAVAWPPTPAGAGGVVAFVTGQGLDPAVLRSRLRATLPGHAVPRAIHVLDRLPLNANGKTDRHALIINLTDAAPVS
jgi:amino acid adenylation domain-containing protein